ncbi:superfamily II DNA/RNA helicase, SNF2 family [Oceanotoga phage vB_OteS-UFV02]
MIKVKFIRQKKDNAPKHLRFVPENISESKILKRVAGMLQQRDGTFHFPFDSFILNLMINSDKYELKLDTQTIQWLEFENELLDDLNKLYQAKRIDTMPEFQYDFQTVDTAMMARIPNPINANDMGLGKTIEIIGYINTFKPKKTLIVVPASLKYNWESELEKWCNLSYVGTNYNEAKKRHKALEENKSVYVVNYEMLDVVKYPELFKITWDLVVCDEAHKLKNLQTKWSRHLTGNKRGAKYEVKKLPRKKTILMTGTPLANNPLELFSLLHIQNPMEVSNRDMFVQNFCETAFNPFGREPLVVGVKNAEALHKMIAKYMFRRTKEDELDLPEKIYQNIEIKLSKDQEKLYKKLVKDYFLEKKDQDYLEVNSGMELALRLRQLSLDPRILGLEGKSNKTQTIIELVQDTNQQVVIFTSFKTYANLLKEEFDKAKVKVSMYTGDTKHADRRKSIDDFQKGNTQVFLSTITAGGVGLNLQNANIVLFADKPYSPHLVKQAEDRCYRNGQKNKVTIISVINRGTVEDDIEYILYDKQNIIDQVIVEREVVERLLQGLMNT